jgi:signal transduction histidine kinase
MTLFRGKLGGMVSFLAIAALVVGGLGWVTREALRMEEERRVAAVARECEKLQQERDERWQERLGQIRADRSAKMRQALMLLDSRLTPALAREDSRPYEHFEALCCPYPAVNSTGMACEPGQVFLPSPLMTAQLPDWIVLHFEVDAVKGWTSPQVISDGTQKMLQKQPIDLALNNVDDSHRKLLDELRSAYPVTKFLTALGDNGLKFEAVTAQQLQWQFQLGNTINLNNSNPANGMANGGVNWPNGYAGAQPVPTIAQNTTSNPNYLNINGPASNTSNATTGPQQQLAAGNFDQQQDNNKRMQTMAQARNEGLWTSNKVVQGGFPYKTLDSKQKEIEALQKLVESTSEQAKKRESETKLEALKKEVESLKKSLKPVEIRMTSMQPLWLPSPEQPKHLLMVRPVLVGDRPIYQGMALDWARLQDGILKPTIADLLPDARFIPRAKSDPERLDREMFALPIELDPGPLAEPEAPEPVEAPPLPAAEWTPLRIGLVLAWAAALVALCAVGLGGWSLLDFSERRIRFVSAVTHELRTPLTTLRLYLDLLNSGLITEEKQRDEYIKTLSGEADRLHRLIGNVLDFARLEKTRPTVEHCPVNVAELLQHLQATWQERCAASGKNLQIACAIDPAVSVSTDRNLVEQVLGNLIDNARKYSQDSPDSAIILRAIREDNQLVIEIEDRGPGVTKRERGAIFRPFRRGREADVKAGGVGLGLALATRWASMIGGRLSVKPGAGNVGACFRLEIPG